MTRTNTDWWTMEFTDLLRNRILSVGEALSWDTLVGNHLLGTPTLCVALTPR
jgi:hypothetical protein